MSVKHAHIRIDNDGLLSHTCRVMFVEKDGTETDISSCVQGILVNMHVGDITTAQLDCIKVIANVRAELTEVAVKELHPRRRRSWWRRAREVTGFNDKAQVYVR